MNLRCRRGHAALAVILVAAYALLVVGTSAAGQASYAPPLGGPDLSRIALATDDFPDALVGRQGYVKPSRELGFVAEYDRVFKRATLGSSHKQLLGFEDDVSLARTPARAQRALESLALGLGLAAGQLRAELAKQFGVKPGAVTISAPSKAGAGDDSVALRVELGGRMRLTVLLAAVRVGPVVSFFYAAGARLSSVDTRGLATLVVRRTRGGLAPA